MLIYPPITVHEGPPQGKNGWTSYAGVHVYEGAKEGGAVVAHESLHWQFIWRLALLFLIPSIILGILAWYLELELAGFAAVILIVPAFMARKWFKPAARVNEARAKMVESLVAQRYYHRDLNDYMAKEARSLARYDQFDGWTEGQAFEMMKEQMPRALAFVGENRRFIERWCGRLPN